MAWLVGLQLTNGDWDNFVFSRFTYPFHYTTDILGRELPSFRYLEAYEGLKKEDAERTAHELRGVPKGERRAVFLDRVAPLKKRYHGGTLK